MSEHKVALSWTRETADFVYETYNRTHTLSFDNGLEVQASSAPAFFGDPTKLDPEEILVAALTSCHMLTFLALAAKKRYIVERYEDKAVGVLGKNEEGKLCVTTITLQPNVLFSGERQPTADELHTLHERAHSNCFIANSIRSHVTLAPVLG